MKEMLLISMLFLFSKTNGQQYFNQHFQIGNFSTTPNNFLKYNDNLIISYLNGDENNNLQSGLIQFNENENSIQNTIFKNIRLAKDGVFLKNGLLGLYGKKVSIDKNLLYFNFDIESEIILDSVNYNSILDYNFPFGGNMKNNYFYMGYIDFNSENDQRQFGMIKTDLSGNFEYQRNYNQEINNSDLNTIRILNDSSIFVGLNIYDQNKQEQLAQIINLNQSGERIRSITSEEEKFESSTDAPLEILNFNLILQTYQVKRPTSNPIRLDFYDNELNLEFYKIVPSTFNKEITSYNLKKGKSEYFFIYGSFYKIVEEKTYGYLAKVDFNGEIIWQHIYQHPDYPAEFVDYGIGDIIEKENGDIYCMGHVFPLVSPQELWLFKVNDIGCFGDASCDELVITDVEDLLLEPQEIEVYPNPANETVYIKSETDIEALQAYRLDGQEIKGDLRDQQLDISSWNSGVYLIHILLTTGTKASFRVVKI